MGRQIKKKFALSFRFPWKYRTCVLQPANLSLQSYREEEEPADKTQSDCGEEEKKKRGSFMLIPLRIHYGGGSMEKQRKFYNKHKKTAKTLSIIVGAFLVCWLPFFFLYLISKRPILFPIEPMYVMSEINYRYGAHTIRRNSAHQKSFSLSLIL